MVIHTGSPATVTLASPYPVFTTLKNFVWSGDEATLKSPYRLLNTQSESMIIFVSKLYTADTIMNYTDYITIIN